MLKFNVLLLVLLSRYTYVIVNHLNLKYICRSAMAEWLTYLTKDVGGTQFESLQIPVINLLMFVWVFFLPATVKQLRTREQQGIHSFAVFITLTTK